MKFTKVPDRGDPSNGPQLFSGLNINLLCCRFWWLNNWESRNMSFPYWRIYWNKTTGGEIAFGGKRIELTPDQIVLIPPYTAFSSRLKNHSIPLSGYHLEGGRVGEGDSETASLQSGAVLHLFIHFNLGMPYDFISPQLFSFAVSDDLKRDLSSLSDSLTEHSERLSVQSSMLVYKIIILTITQIAGEFRNLATTDQRVVDVLREIEDHIAEELSNDRLARIANMAVNSFARTFKEEIGMPPQQFIRERRVQKASILLHHSNDSMEDIARASGFCDRFHLARVFKEVTSYSPAQYRKQFYPKS